MSMTEPVEAPAPKPKRKYRRRKLPPALPKQAAGGPAGITSTKCPNVCNVEGCWITGTPICGHPQWGQGNVKGQEAIQRLNAAKRALGKRRMEVV